MTARPVRLSCGDLDGMDVEDLRRHLAEHINETGRAAFAYVDGVAGRLSRLTGIDRQEIISNACDDALFIAEESR